MSTSILVVDDDNDTRAVIVITLRAFGYTVFQAENGEEAVSFCQKSCPDLIIADIMMPIMSGTELIKWVRGNIKHTYVPILALSALSEIDDRVSGLEAGADEYLTKPFQHPELHARVKVLLRTKALMDQLAQKNEELNQAYTQLREMQSKLVKHERQLLAVQLAGAAAHKLGQPVTSILLNCHLLEKDERDQVSVLSQIRQECNTLNEIILRLQSVDGNAVTEYVDNQELLDLK